MKNSIDTQPLLHDEQCEKEVLGVMLTYPDTFEQSIEYVAEDAFYNSLNRFIYQCIAAVKEQGEIPDLIAVNQYANQHPQKGIEYETVCLTECINSVVSSITFVQNLQRLADLAKRRQFYLIGAALMAAGKNEQKGTEEIQTEAIQALNGLTDNTSTTVLSVKDALRGLDNIIKSNIEGNHINGMPTGFEFLDEKGGLQKADLWVIGADTSQGKTAFALDLCVNVAINGFPCAFYSTEMLSTQLSARMVAAKSGVSSRQLLQTRLSTNDLSKYDAAVGALENLPLYIDESSTISVERIILSIRSLCKKKGVKVAFVDYLQVLQTNEKRLNQTEEQFFGTTARKLKNLAKELQICIVLLSQVSRDKKTNEPYLSRLRGSGQIGEAADTVLLIYRPEVYGKRYAGQYSTIDPKGTALIKVAKGRNIGIGNFFIGFDAPTTHFFSLKQVPTISLNEKEDAPLIDFDSDFEEEEENPF